ncbi:hypothetical protein M2164_004024 [Streptomyces sp. SAI-208]|nr:hypothetical protein [Streptomyces sp. SAI-208]
MVWLACLVGSRKAVSVVVVGQGYPKGDGSPDSDRMVCVFAASVFW